MPLKTAQIGRCGELLVQCLLLLRGVESAPMSTDSGVDLVAYAPKLRGPMAPNPRLFLPVHFVESSQFCCSMNSATTTTGNTMKNLIS